MLRRAAELDHEPAGSSIDDRLPVEAIEAAAAEVGLPAVAVRQAVAELRAGLLTEEQRDVAGAPIVIVEAAVVPLAPEAALEVVGRWLNAQTFRRHRGRDGAEVWRVREDWVASVQRSFDWSASVRLKDVREVIVRAVTVEEGTLLRLEATLEGRVAAAPGVGAGAGAVVGSGAGMSAGMLVLGGPPSVMAASAVVAGLGAVGGWRIGRRVRRSRAERIADELSAELDRIAGGDTGPGPLDKLRARARRLHGPRA